MRRPRLPFQRHTLAADSTAGLVLGVESVPDGLASGLLAGVNPVYGLYAYMVGTVAGALVTSSAFMAVQATGAMSILIADVGAIQNASDSGRALFTLSIVTGVIMLTAGLLRLGSLLRFVSNGVMVGFINAVGVNIVLGQLANFTGWPRARTASPGRSAPCCTRGDSTGPRWPSASPPCCSSSCSSAPRSAPSAWSWPSCSPRASPHC